MPPGSMAMLSKKYVAHPPARARLHGERSPGARREAHATGREDLAGLEVDVALVRVRMADVPRFATARRERLLDRLAVHDGAREERDGAG